MLSIKNYVNKPSSLGISLLVHFGQWLSDSAYLRLMYHLSTGCKLNLNNPQTFGEKIQWLKLYNRKPEYTTLVDKYTVKDYVANLIGKEFVIPTLGVWDRPEDIEWGCLPNQFVLKTTHGGGSTGVVVCRDKSTFDRIKAIDLLNNSLKIDIFKMFREWPYKDVPKRVIAEEYIAPCVGVKDLPDYKWYCFNGVPKYCQVIQNRSTKETIDFFDTDWNHQKFTGLNPAVGPAVVPPEKPVSLLSQIHIASVLSANKPFSRIDLYEIDGRVYFGEVTFFPMSGLGIFRPNEFNLLLGKMIVLRDCPSD